MKVARYGFDGFDGSVCVGAAQFRDSALNEDEPFDIFNEAPCPLLRKRMGNDKGEASEGARFDRGHRAGVPVETENKAAKLAKGSKP